MGENEKWIPQAGMRFRNPDEAWVFWLSYGGRAGFDVRKRNKHISKCDGQVSSCRFVCSNEGIRKKGLTLDHVPKRNRAETRTNCKARMIITLDRVENNYEATDIQLEHNHYLQLPQTCHLMSSQRKISEEPTKVTTSKNKGAKQQKKHDGVEPQVGVKKKDGSHKGANVELQECNAIMSFTELLTTPSYGVYDDDMF